MYRFIINKQYVELLRKLARSGKHDVLSISRETKMAYGHMSTVISQFAKEGIVVKERTNEGPGMKVNISITEKGKIVINAFNKIEEAMENEDLNQIANDQKEVKNGKNRK